MHAEGDTGILGGLANASFLEETKATWVWFFALKKKKKQNLMLLGAALSAANLALDLNLCSCIPPAN